MTGLGVGALALALWVLVSVPLGILIGRALRRRDSAGAPKADIPRQRGGDAPAGLPHEPAPPARLAASARAAVRGVVTAATILVGALTFTVGTAAAVSSLPGPAPAAVAGVIEAITPFRVHAEPVADPPDAADRAVPAKRARKAPRSQEKVDITAPAANNRTSTAVAEPTSSAVPLPAPSPTSSSPTSSSTPSPSGTASPTESASPSSISTESPQPTEPATTSPSPTPDSSTTATASPSPTATATATATATPTASPTASPTSLGLPDPAG